MVLCMWLHPLPTSPIKGEVLCCDFGPIAPHEWSFTSPLMGEVRRGWFPTLDAERETP